MLVSFRVKNYRSFAQEQTFSLVAGTSAKKEQQFSFETSNNFAPSLLRSACILGANAAGKSSFIAAMTFFQHFVRTSIRLQEGDKIPTVSNRLHSELCDQPSEFEIVFIYGEGLYQYGFSVDHKRVWDEWLFFKPNATRTATRKLFQREYNQSNDSYTWYINSTFIKGEKNSWKNQTTANVLFLARAVQLNAGDLKEPFYWIKNNLRFIKSIDRLSTQYTSKKCLESNKNKDKIISLLHSVGLEIAGFNVKEKTVDISKITDKVFVDELVKQFQKQNIMGYAVETAYTDDKDKTVKLSLEKDESDGTKALYSMSAPLFDVLENGYTLVIDELHNSLHPHALKVIISLFHDPNINKNNAQLVFTSHETSVMADGFMHKDQIWFADKRKSHATQLIPLSDYKLRELTNFQKAYLNGRFGGTPTIREFPNDE